MKLSKTTWVIAATWAFLVGGGAIVAFLLPRGPARTSIGDFLLCLAPLFANAGLLWNAASEHRRTNYFWMLLGLGCTVWLISQLTRMYFQLVLHFSPGPSAPDLIFFLHTVPMIAALALQPHARKIRDAARYDVVDFALLGWLWLYIYAFVALPWNTVFLDRVLYARRDFQAYFLENLIFMAGLVILCFRAQGKWRRIYAHLIGAALVYDAAFFFSNGGFERFSFVGRGRVELLTIASFAWFGTAGILAHQGPQGSDVPDEDWKPDVHWPAKLGMSGVLLLPLAAAWSVFISDAPPAVQRFRLLTTLTALIGGTALVFLRQHFVDIERAGLVAELQSSLDNMKRLQTQLVHSEKLVSLGRLAAGAAHEINNPLTAILGYAEMLIEDESSGTRTRGYLEKIRDQARRTRDIVSNLLNFARPVVAGKQLLDLNTVLGGAVQLRTLDIRGKNIRIDLRNPTVLPAVRGDPNQLLQVISHVINNAVDSMETVGGGVLTIRASRDRSNVVLEFTDNGPGIREPEKVFDPFYTTKPVGKGTGLGLSICYSIIQEHGGQISCFNRTEGGCTFRVELPAVIALFPQTQKVTPAVTVNSN